MRCPRCATDNRSAARFCRGCGDALWPLVECPACLAQTPREGAHCDQCGHSLREAVEAGGPRPLPPPRSTPRVPPWEAEDFTPAQPVRFRAEPPPRRGDDDSAEDHTDEVVVAELYGRASTLSGETPTAPARLGAPDTDEEEAAGRPPLLGREVELAELLDIWNECRDQRRTAVVEVSGPEGSGRSRLLGELARLVGRDPVAFVLPVPPAPEVEAGAFAGLRIALDDLQTSRNLDVAALLAGELPALLGARAEAVLTTWMQGDPVPLRPRAAALRAVLVDALFGLARTADGLLVLLDGAADASALDLARGLLRRGERAGGAILVVVEVDGPSLGGVGPAGAHRPVTLGPLPDELLEQTVAELPGADALEEGWASAAEGRPGVAVLLAHARAARAARRSDERARSAGPDADVATQESGRILEQEAPVVRTVASRAAVLGEVVARDALDELCHDVTGPDGVAAALEALHRRGLVDAVGRGELRLAPWLRFRLRAGRAAALERLDAKEARELHRRAALVLERRPGSAPLIRARHLDEAHERLAAAGAYVSAAEEALGEGRWVIGREAAARAAALLEALGSEAPASLLMRADLMAARALHATHAFAAAAFTARRGLARPEAARSPLSGELKLVLGDALARARDDGALALLEEARATLKNGRAAHAARALGEALLQAGDAPAAQALLEDALARARTEAQPDATAGLARALARSLAGRGGAAEASARALLEEACSTFEKLGVLDELVGCWIARGEIEGEAGRSSVIQALARAHDLADALCDAGLSLGVAQARARQALRRSDHDEADRALGEAEALAGELSDQAALAQLDELREEVRLARAAAAYLAS